MKQCFAVYERHPVLPDKLVHLAPSFVQASHIATVKNGDHIKLTEPNRYYVGVARMR
jgi:hypothetical protein